MFIFELQLNCMNISPNNELYATATDSFIKVGDLVNGHVHVRNLFMLYRHDRIDAVNAMSF
jgi:hypothetical protein